MLRRTTYSITIAVAALLLVPALASAATPNQIFKDAEDGSIDGNYSLTDLRAADAAVRPDQREYFLWDEIYAAALSRIANPNAPKPPKLTIVKPVDSNGNGTIDDSEVTAAATKTKALNKKKLEKIDEIVEETTVDEVDEAEDIEPVNSSGDSDDDGGTAWPVIVLGLLVLIIGGVAGWRVYAARRKPGSKPGSTTKPASRPKKPK